MVLETFMKLCMTAQFFAKTFLPPKLEKQAKNRGFLNLKTKLVIIFTEFVLQWKFLLFAVFLLNSYIWENSCSWNIGQNVLSQSDCRIFKWTINGFFWLNSLDWNLSEKCSNMGMTSLVSGWYLKNDLMEITNGIDSWKLKGGWKY